MSQLWKLHQTLFPWCIAAVNQIATITEFLNMTFTFIRTYSPSRWFLQFNIMYMFHWDIWLSWLSLDPRGLIGVFDCALWPATWSLLIITMYIYLEPSFRFLFVGFLWVLPPLIDMSGLACTSPVRATYIHCYHSSIMVDWSISVMINGVELKNSCQVCKTLSFLYSSHQFNASLFLK